MCYNDSTSFSSSDITVLGGLYSLPRLSSAALNPASYVSNFLRPCSQSTSTWVFQHVITLLWTRIWNAQLHPSALLFVPVYYIPESLRWKKSVYNAHWLESSWLRLYCCRVAHLTFCLLDQTLWNVKAFRNGYVISRGENDAIVNNRSIWWLNFRVAIFRPYTAH
jgi:hypothetical protein